MRKPKKNFPEKGDAHNSKNAQVRWKKIFQQKFFLIQVGLSSFQRQYRSTVLQVPLRNPLYQSVPTQQWKLAGVF